MASKRTTIRLSDERQLLLDRASEIVASGPDDDPPTSDVIDAALTHLIESRKNMQSARKNLDPVTIQQFNTPVLALQYRAVIDERWR
ncbi:DUF7386 family protein [Natronocalculus amylovorans]|uniref:DUF7386 family protein n=1 Tax=Natronocalculus amylovorans TaxID=2917812 RepID=UPI003CCC9B3D